MKWFVTWVNFEKIAGIFILLKKDKLVDGVSLYKGDNKNLNDVSVLITLHFFAKLSFKIYRQFYLILRI